MLISGLMPTPPATNTTRADRSVVNDAGALGGGNTKLPPTRIRSVRPRIVSESCHSQAAAGFSGDFLMASSIYRSVDLLEVTALDGDEVMVKPPALAMPGQNASTHWPGRNLSVSRCRWRQFLLAYREKTYVNVWCTLWNLETQQANKAADECDLAQDDGMK